MQNSNATNANDYSLVSDFLGYRAKEDVTNMPPGYLVQGSQNVLTTTSSRVSIRPGYTLDGQANATVTGIRSSCDFEMSVGGYVRHLRYGNAKLQYRYVAAAGDYWNGTTFTAGQVYWIDLLTGQTASKFRFTGFWDFDTELLQLLLMVRGDSNILMWSGGVTTIDSATNAAGVISVLNPTPTAGGAGYAVGDVLTITTGGTGATCRVDSVTAGAVTAVTLISPGTGYTTGAGKATSGGSGAGCTVNITTVVTGYIKKTGTTTWGEEGFLKAGTRAVVINGTSYPYTGGEATLYLVGITGSPSAEPANSVAHQEVRTTANSAIAALPDTFKNWTIGNLKNQIYVGATDNNSVYISKVNSYTDFSFTTPVRVVGQGAILTLDGVPTAMVPQEQEMYISAGLSQWYKTQFTLSSDNADESLQIERLKTGPLQSAISQEAVFKVKNSVMFLNHETTLDELGRVENILGTPQQTNISDPIKLDFDSYDFEDACGIYNKYFAYVAIPRDGVVRVFNFAKNFWEAPQVMPISCFSVIDGELYGHSSAVPETYKLFTGHNDNGAPIEAIAKFSYQNFGMRSWRKEMERFYVEGYIASNSSLTLNIRYEIDGCGQEVEKTLSGASTQFVCARPAIGSLGKAPLGGLPLGGASLARDPSLPPKFRWAPSVTPYQFFEMQPTFYSNGVDYQWELLAFGPRVKRSPYDATDIVD